MATVINLDLSTVNWPSSVPLRVILPRGWDERASGKRAVLFLLHGLFGNCDNWIELTPVVELVDERGYAVITPEAWDSWYVNSASEASKAYERFFLDDLISWADERFGPSLKRGIAGLSMGGFGSFILACKRPELFRFAYSTSGAFIGPQVEDETDDFEELKDSARRAFGDEGGRQRQENDVFNLLETSRSSPGIEFLFDCGKDDSLLDVNRSLATAFGDSKYAFSYNEYSGGHDWDYWNSRLADILGAADRMLTS